MWLFLFLLLCICHIWHKTTYAWEHLSSIVLTVLFLLWKMKHGRIVISNCSRLFSAITRTHSNAEEYLDDEDSDWADPSAAARRELREIYYRPKMDFAAVSNCIPVI